MKNYKHSVKSNNAMKLAAVASAAIMMAPVALNSVSTFAATTPTAAQVAADTKTYTKDDVSTAYDAFTLAFNKLSAADQQTVLGTQSGKVSTTTVALDMYKAQVILYGKSAINVKDPYANGYAAFLKSATPAQLQSEYKTLYIKMYASDSSSKAVVADTAKAEATAKTNAAAASSLSDGATAAFKEYTSTISKAPSLASSAAATALVKAVDDAQTAAKTGTPYQVTAAASALAEAKGALEHAYADFSQSAAEQTAKTNSAPASAANTATLAKAIEQALALYGSTVKTSATAAAAAGFAAQIKGAQSVQANIVSKKLSNAAVTAATADLTKAFATYATTVATKGSQNDVKEFKENEAKTTAAKEAAKAALAKAIDNAKTSEAALASYKGTNAASVAAFNAFDGVITAAQAVYRNANATPAALNAAANVAKAAATLGDTLAKNGKDFNNFKAAQNAIAALKALKQKIASTQTGVAHINYAKGYGIRIWTLDHKLVMTDATHAKKAMGGKNYKVFGSVAYINGKKYYNGKHPTK
mgnify:CR=1 FL=1